MSYIISNYKCGPKHVFWSKPLKCQKWPKWGVGGVGGGGGTPPYQSLINLKSPQKEDGRRCPFSRFWSFFALFRPPPFLKSRKTVKKHVQKLSKKGHTKTCTFTIFFAFLKKVSKFDNFIKNPKNIFKNVAHNFIFLKKIKYIKL